MKTWKKSLIALAFIALFISLVNSGNATKPVDDKMPVPIPCYLDHFIVSYGAECSSAGQGCIPNPCPK